MILSIYWNILEIYSDINLIKKFIMQVIGLTLILSESTC